MELRDKERVLYEVAMNNYFGIEKYLTSPVNEGANICDQRGMTPLMVACSYGYYNMVSLLLKYGANVNAVCNNGFSALEYTTNKTEGINIIWALINTGRLKGNYKEKLLRIACVDNYLPIVEFVLKEGNVDLNRVNLIDRTVLMDACYYGYFEIVKFLVESGVNISFRNIYGVTAFDLAKTQEIKDVILSKKQFFIGKYERNLDF